MADPPGILEEQGVAFASNDKPASGAHQCRSRPGHSVATAARLPEMDELLENALVKAINIAEPLTRREEEILRLVVSGKTNKEIARVLCRTKRTVEYHRNRLMHKFNAHNAADLVKRAIAVGIV